MANQEQLDILRQGVDTWNKWRAKGKPDLFTYECEARGFAADLSRANLRGANLRGADLRGDDLREVDLESADLQGAYLNEANLRGANLRGADLGRANLSEANLSEADLSWTGLVKANLSEADLSRSNMKAAILSETVFVDVNLSSAKGLDACIHSGPSTLDHRTLAQSGRLPLAFLRGCGLPDTLIDYLPSLLNEPIQFYSCFISYSTKDQDFVDRLYADLQNRGVRCWFAPHDMKGGKKVHEQIDDAIRVYDRLLLILSRASMSSEWVETEIAKARKRELQEERRMLFPVRLVEFGTLRDWECFDADMGKDSAREIREYYVPDFSNWKNHDAYQEEFEKLLRDLKADTNSTATT